MILTLWALCYFIPNGANYSIIDIAFGGLAYKFMIGWNDQKVIDK